jgi:hypothetical protein
MSMPEELRDEEAVYRVAVRRALAAEDPSQVELHFDVAVLDRYRADPSCSIIRTDTVGRVRKQGSWSLDFGISPDEDMLHATWGQMLTLPEAVREHFAAHARLMLASRVFVQMRMAPGSCLDDGEVRNWE